jgi:long-chain acyl-CoA synthetase
VPIDYFLNIFKENKFKNAVFWNDSYYNYDYLIKEYENCKSWINENSITSGNVVAVEGDFSPKAIAFLLALIDTKCIIIPLTKSVENKIDEFCKVSQAEVIINIDKNDNLKKTNLNVKPDNKLYHQLIKDNNPGLVLFSSGSTGKSKASVHDFNSLLNKYKVRRKTLNTITFLLYDHIGGINTLFYILSNGGLIVTIQERNPNHVLKIIEKCKVELLPTSPTFINLILISEAYKKYNISSLKLVTYGTEPMPEITLKKFNSIFPNVKVIQTYGLSEVGILSSKSKSSDSLWVKIGGSGFKTRIINNMLEIKAESAMLGYLNAESPYTDDGWFKTGDLVETKGDYIKILGRKSEIINVGGEKVYPQEVENVILELNNVADVTVFSEKSAILGNYVCAKVAVISNSSDIELEIKKIKSHCLKKLERFKVPIKIKIIKEVKFSKRFKKQRLLS